MKIVPCKSCGADIFFVRMRKTGRSMPLDAKPQKLVWLIGGDGNQEGEMVEVYASHFSTCPNAAQHRRPVAETATRSGQTVASLSLGHEAGAADSAGRGE